MLVVEYVCFLVRTSLKVDLFPTKLIRRHGDKTSVVQWLRVASSEVWGDFKMGVKSKGIFGNLYAVNALHCITPASDGQAHFAIKGPAPRFLGKCGDGLSGEMRGWVRSRRLGNAQCPRRRGSWATRARSYHETSPDHTESRQLEVNQSV
jgi:hypothetical protein